MMPPKVLPIKFKTVDGEHTVTIDGVLEAASEQIPPTMPGAVNLDMTVSEMAFLSLPDRLASGAQLF